jgi:LysM repeat protein
MKILRFSGIVLGIHLLALFLIFANPGCSSSTKPQPSKADTVTATDTPRAITVATSGGAPSDRGASPISFNADTARYSPTRPGTPAASTLEIEPVSNVIPASTYTVVLGDNLSVIAKKNHIGLAELAAANNLDVNSAKLRPGQKLIVPGKAPTPPKPTEAAAQTTASMAAMPGITADTAASKPPGDVVKHTVKSGDTLSSIAQKYGVKLGDIAAANSIPDPQKIRLGQELVIPGWQAPASRSGRTQKSGGEANARQSTMTNPATTPGPIGDPNARTATPANEVPIIQVEEAPAPTK